MRRLVVVLGLISCRAPTPVLEVPDVVDFPPTACLGEATLVLENTGRAPVRFTSVAFESGAEVEVLPLLTAPNAVFTLTLPDVVSPGETANVPVRFFPERGAPAQTFSTAILLRSGEASWRVGLSGTRTPGLALARTVIDFGPLGVGDSWDVAFPLADAGLSNERLPPGPFQRAGDALRFAPQLPGEWTGPATWDFQRAPNCEPTPVRVFLQGVGAPTVVFADPVQLDFGYVPAGLQRALRVWVENVSLRPVELAGVSISGAQVFFVDGADGGLIPAGRRDGGAASPLIRGRTTFDVRYAPQGTGADQASLDITTTLASLPVLRVPLVGRVGGPDVEVTPALLDFPDPATQATRELRVVNVGVRATPPDPRANLFLGRDGGEPWFELVHRSGAMNTLTVTLGAYNPVVGLAGISDLRIFVTTLPVPSVHDLQLFTNDLDEPVVTVPIVVH